jgi:hypothetical protein
MRSATARREDEIAMIENREYLIERGDCKCSPPLRRGIRNEIKIRKSNNK